MTGIRTLIEADAAVPPALPVGVVEKSNFVGSRLVIVTVAALVAPRRMLFCQARDVLSPGADVLAARFLRVAASSGKSWMRYEPDRAMDAKLVLDWIAGH